MCDCARRLLSPRYRVPAIGCAVACLAGDRESVSLDSVKQNGRFTDNHLGRSTGMIVGGYSAMVVAPSL